RYPITGIAGCCARAASGHVAVAPRRVMNSRRLMSPPGRFTTMLNPRQILAFAPRQDGPYWPPAQPVDATHALNRSAGVSKPKVLRGRSLSRQPIADITPKADTSPRYHLIVLQKEVSQCAGKLTASYSLNRKKSRETKVKQEQRAVVIDNLLNEANRQGDKIKVEGSTDKEAAPVK